MNRLIAIVSLLLISLLACGASSQESESPIKIFGYFQNSLQHWTASSDQPDDQNFFNLQQLNIFFQKDLGPNWTAFVNFEALNNFSSSRQWGAFNLEEAWVKYRANMRFNLKLGLQIPIFNNFNEIKNRTPLLPYIIRPVVYETSFNELLPLELFAPARAFVQAYGFFPAGKTKFDYAVYAGNSPNINTDPERGQTGIDTTATFLVGGRLGIRHQELKFGLSATHEKTNEFATDYVPDFEGDPSALQLWPMIRFGGDLSYNLANFSLESEFIVVNVDEGIPGAELDLDFFYGALGYHFTDKLFAYGSYLIIEAHSAVVSGGVKSASDEQIKTGTVGISYDLDYRLRLKGQYLRIVNTEKRWIDSQSLMEEVRDGFNIWAIAVSVYF